MTPIRFPEANCWFGPPPNLEESQVRTIHAYQGPAVGSCDGMKVVIVAHMPTDEDRQRIAEGGPIFITQLGGLAPHFLTTNFAEANNPA